MIIQKMPSFLPVAPGQKAILKVPKYALTLTRLILTLGGTFTKAQIDLIRLRHGSHTLWEITGSDLDSYNKYKGIFDIAAQITIDLTERDAPSIEGKEIGGIDLSLLDDELYVEIDINAAAVNPTLAAWAIFTPPQGNPLMKKLVRVLTPTLAIGLNDINFNAGGALLQRVFIKYTGTDWGATTNGNVSQIRVRRDGLPIWEDVTDLVNRFIQQEYRKVPQSRFFVYDPIVDNNQSGAVVTAGVKSLQIQPTLAAADTLTCYFEVLDTPDNL
jgi:hypothetical protein